ncbi:MAG: pyridoxal phosphate-dependent aminotransferase [Candidatus Heteroscillospira sp.]|jgi:threonine-phosphate decarboxylase
MSFAHGGDIGAYQNEILDFSANLNPMGMPEAVKAAAMAAVAGAVHYPDPYCRKVRSALSKRDGVPENWIVCGNGAADLIFRLCMALRPQKALLCAPSFSEYAQALELCSCAVERHPLLPEKSFELGMDYMEKLTEDTDIAFLCTPNNPTGRIIPRPVLEAAANRCRKTGTVLVIDECFLELSDDPAGLGAMLGDNDRIVLLRAFTKSYAMPGLRFGYALSSNGELMEKLFNCGQPWSVSNVAQAAAQAACGCPEWPEKGRALLAQRRPELVEALRGLGLTVWEGQANYILFRAPGVSDLRERTAQAGVLIRSCANYPGLGEDYYRVAVRGAEDNGRCIRALGEVLKNG